MVQSSTREIFRRFRLFSKYGRMETTKCYGRVNILFLGSPSLSVELNLKEFLVRSDEVLVIEMARSSKRGCLIFNVKTNVRCCLNILGIR